MKTLVLGLGNLLLADEGIGVHVAHALMAKGVPDTTTVLDIGTAILDALPALESAENVIIVDAMKANGLPGTVYRIGLNECVQKEYVASMHGFDIARALALTQRVGTPTITVIGIEPECIEWSMQLSPNVAASIPMVIKAVEKETGIK